MKFWKRGDMRWLFWKKPPVKEGLDCPACDRHYDVSFQVQSTMNCPPPCGAQFEIIPDGPILNVYLRQI